MADFRDGRSAGLGGGDQRGEFSHLHRWPGTGRIFASGRAIDLGGWGTATTSPSGSAGIARFWRGGCARWGAVCLGWTESPRGICGRQQSDRTESARSLSGLGGVGTLPRTRAHRRCHDCTGGRPFAVRGSGAPSSRGWRTSVSLSDGCLELSPYSFRRHSPEGVVPDRRCTASFERRHPFSHGSISHYSSC
mgnify:CR=1 FL=1